MDDRYLAHHGVKGMKWGVRRYQQYGEGGYIPKKRSSKETWDRNAKVSMYVSKNLMDLQNVDRGIKRASGNSKYRREAKTMSDRELITAINRMNMERQYASLKEEDMNAGRVTIGNILEIAVPAASLAAGVVSTIAMVKGFRNR